MSSSGGGSRSRRALRALGALVAFGLIAVAAQRYRAWVDGQDTRGTPAKHIARESPAPRTGYVAEDLLARFDMDARIEYGPPREVGFGEEQAIMRVATTDDDPQAVFGRILLAQQRARTPTPALGSLLSRAEPLQAVFRTQSQLGEVAGVPFLLRLPIDVPAARAGVFRMEPGALTLAFDKGGEWDFVFFHFPQGVASNALLGDEHRARAILAPLGAEFARRLPPQHALDIGRLGPAGAPATVFCRPAGDAEAALREAVGALADDGWRVASPEVEGLGTRTFRIARDEMEAWIRAEGADTMDAWVTVVIASR